MFKEWNRFLYHGLGKVITDIEQNDYEEKRERRQTVMTHNVCLSHVKPVTIIF